jgi:hypothetical protein
MPFFPSQHTLPYWDSKDITRPPLSVCTRKNNKKKAKL